MHLIYRVPGLLLTAIGVVLVAGRFFNFVVMTPFLGYAVMVVGLMMLVAADQRHTRRVRRGGAPALSPVGYRPPDMYVPPVQEFSESDPTSPPPRFTVPVTPPVPPAPPVDVHSPATNDRGSRPRPAPGPSPQATAPWSASGSPPLAVAPGPAPGPPPGAVAPRPAPGRPPGAVAPRPAPGPPPGAAAPRPAPGAVAPRPAPPGPPRPAVAPRPFFERRAVVPPSPFDTPPRPGDPPRWPPAPKAPPEE